MSTIFRTVLSATFLLATQVVADTCVSTIAGSGDKGYLDGPALSSQFYQPSTITLDGYGNYIITDSYNNRIRLLTPNGTIYTIAGNGSTGNQDGFTLNAVFNFPVGIAGDGLGNMYITDTYNSVIRKMNATGYVSTVTGRWYSTSINGGTTYASFNEPNGIVVDGSKNLVVADMTNHKILRVTLNGGVTTIAGSGVAGTSDGIDASASFNRPSGLAIDSSNNIYVTDSGSSLIRKITSFGLVTTVAGSGSDGIVDGPVSTSKFRFPTGIAIDAIGTIYIADTGSSLIRKISNGVVSTVAGIGWGFSDGPGSKAQFDRPGSVMIDSQGNLIVVDTMNHRIRKITMGNCSTTVVNAVTSDARSRIRVVLGVVGGVWSGVVIALMVMG